MIRLADDQKDKERLEAHADLFSLLMTLERLERAFQKDWVTSAAYTEECQKLIQKWRLMQPRIKDYATLDTLGDFAALYQLACPSAVVRLRTGVPVTTEVPVFVSGRGDGKSSERLLAAAERFITLMDALRLGQHAVDQLHPLVSDLLDALAKLDMRMPPAEVERVSRWLSTLNSMRASESLSEEQGRQFVFDVETAYAAWRRQMDIR